MRSLGSHQRPEAVLFDSTSLLHRFAAFLWTGCKSRIGLTPFRQGARQNRNTLHFSRASGHYSICPVGRGALSLRREDARAEVVDNRGWRIEDRGLAEGGGSV